ncbi:MAG: hypothetical protein EBS50_01690, partial [Sphingomonadaceae bacterium]|nr:hypothetical protein [Sphingomonadaceae bacterium]
MSLALASRRAAISPAWVKNPLWRTARAVPSLDLPFADTKSLADAVTGQSLVTFTRASSGTYVGSDGLIKTATTNLLLRSEEIGTSPWGTNVSGSVTYTANAVASPTGTVTADRVTATADFAGPNQFVSVISGLSYTLSFYIKAVSAGVKDQIRIEFFSGRFAQFRISTLAFSGVNAGITTTSAQVVGDGWVRVALTALAPSTGSLASAVYANTDADFYLWGAQLEQSSTVGEYIPTTSTINSAPRFDHNPTTGESLGLLVEEQRTNSIRNNTMVGAVAGTPGTAPTNWAITSTANGITREIVGTGTENGITYVDLKYSGTASTATNISLAFEGNAQIVAAQNDVWSISLYAKLVSGSWANTAFAIFVNSYTSGGVFDALGTSLVSTYANPTSAALQTQRYTARATLSSATTARVNGGLFSSIANGATIDFTLRIGLPQLEQGAFATSVIPTSTATVTRSADVASITGANFSSWYRQDEGTVFAGGSSFDARTNDGIFLAVFDDNSIS